MPEKMHNTATLFFRQWIEKQNAKKHRRYGRRIGTALRLLQSPGKAVERFPHRDISAISPTNDCRT